MCATLPHLQNAHIHTRGGLMWLALSNLPSVWRRRSRRGGMGGHLGKKGREEVRGDQWRLRQGTQRCLRSSDWRRTHTSSLREKRPSRISACSSDGHQRPGSRSRIQTRAIQRGYLHPQPAPGKTVWDLSIWSTRSLTCLSRSEAAQKLACARSHIWEPERRRRPPHVDVLVSGDAGGSSHDVKVSPVDSVFISFHRPARMQTVCLSTGVF